MVLLSFRKMFKILQKVLQAMVFLKFDSLVTDNGMLHLNANLQGLCGWNVNEVQ